MNTEPTYTPALLSPEEAAGILNLSKQRLANMRVDGDGPAYLKISHRTVRYTPEAIQRWLANKQRRSTGDAAA